MTASKWLKQSFADQSFLQGRKLGAVNSINWARIMAQIVYYFYAAVALGAPHRPVSFSVPTGNFGDIYAGFLAKNMGLPIQQLVVATNCNDILHRCISHNQYIKQDLQATLSPSMDIMVSSNFERLLFDLYGHDGTAIANLVDALSSGQAQGLAHTQWQRAQSVFSSHAVSDQRTCEVIAEVADQHQYLLDPHTAIGLEASRMCNQHADIPMVILATAHPVKFPDAIVQAGQPHPALPPHLADLLDREEHYSVLPNELATVQSHVASRLP